MRWILILPLAPIVAALACESAVSVEEPEIEVRIIRSSDLPQPDASRTFEYAFSSADPESLLTVLWRAEIPVSRAWLPLDNHCLDPRGPRFTVELLRDDARVTSFDFLKDTGRLACATTLKQFTIRD